MTVADLNTLVERYAALASSVARRWGEAYPWLRDDFMSEAAFALWRAALAHDGGGGFGQLARKYIRFALMTRFRDEKIRNKEAFRRAGDVADADGKMVAAVELLADEGIPPDAVLERGEDAGRVRAALADLPPGRRRAIEDHVIDGLTLAAIGTGRGVTGHAVGQQVRRDLERLRERLEPTEE